MLFIGTALIPQGRCLFEAQFEYGLWGQYSFAFTVPPSPFPCCHHLHVRVHCLDHSLSESHETAFISKVINTQPFSGTSLTLLLASLLLFTACHALSYAVSWDLFSSAVHHVICGKNLFFCTHRSEFSSTSWDEGRACQPRTSSLDAGNEPSRQELESDFIFSVPDFISSLCSSTLLCSLSHCHFRLNPLRSQFKNLVNPTSLRNPWFSCKESNYNHSNVTKWWLQCRRLCTCPTGSPTPAFPSISPSVTSGERASPWAR